MTAPSTPTPRAGDDLTRRGPGPAADDARLERLVSATSRYCLDTWLERSLPAGDPRGADEGDVRPLSSVALALAVALRCGALAPGVSPERAVQGAVRAVRACTRGHVSVGGAWGRSWQAPLSSGQLGLTALLLGDDLPNADRAAVERIVREEAVLLTELPVRYLRNTAGQLITPGDTGAEEESWRARGLSAALALLPRDAHALRWLRWLVLRQVAAYASPADVASSTRLHRAPLCAWLGGSNAEPDGSLQNHGFLPAPNYMRPVHHLVAVTQQRLAGQPVSPSALHGVEDLYEALRRLYLGDGGVAFPAGTDVGSRTAILYANDALHRALGLGGAEAGRWERLHGAIAEAQVQPDGSVLEPGVGEPFSPVQPDLAAKLAECLLASRLERLRPDEVDGDVLAGPPQQGVPTGCRQGGRTFPDTSGEVAAAVSWLSLRGLVQGMPDGTYAPSRTVDRATAVVVLHRVAGAPVLADRHGFPDVAADGGELDRTVRWATATGLVRGTADGTFAPRDPLTRGQAVVLLWRGQGRPEAPPSGFTDVAGEVAAAAAWALEARITRGRTATSFDPTRPLDRGAFAVLLHRQHAVG